jgi:biotin carboxyl carrier protein
MARPRTGGDRRPCPDRHARPRLSAGRLGEACGDPRGGGGWRLNAPASIRLAADGEERTVVTTDGPADFGPEAVAGNGVVHVDVDGRSIAFRIAPPPDVDRAARAAAAHGAAGGPVEILAPMPGSVVRVHAAVGAAVEAGDPLVTLEAMKMEHVVVAPSAGRVAEIAVEAGRQVARGDIVAVVEA